MKTSKKLLSFFLAVVMVVTTCSVGFSAFAQENNNSIWNTNSEAEDAFETLDGLANDLLPSLLLGIEAVGNPIYEKKGKELFNKTPDKLTDEEKAKIAEQTTLVDILYVLQPTLLELLEGTSQQDFVEKYFPDFDANTFDVMNDSSAAISFYTLVSLCDKFSQDTVGTGRFQEIGGNQFEIKEKNPLSDDQKKQMKDWYDALMGIAQSATGVDGMIESYAEKYSEDRGSDYKTAALSDLSNFDFGVTAEDETLIENACETTFKEKIAAYHVPDGEITISSLADIIFYFYGAGVPLLEGYYYRYLINLTGTDVTFHETGDPFGFQGNLGLPVNGDYNFDENLTPLTFADKAFEATYKGMRFDTAEDFVTAMGLPATPENVQRVKDMLYPSFYAAYTNTVLPQFFHEALMGIAIENNQVADADEYKELVKEYMPDGWGTEDCVLTDDEINIMTNALDTFRDTKTSADNSEIFFSGQPYSITTGPNKFTVTLPDVLKGTAVADYFKIITSSQNTNSSFVNFRNGLYLSFHPQMFGQDKYLTTDGQVANSELTNIKVDANGVPQYDYDRFSAVKGNIDGLDADGNKETSINGYIARAEDYAYSKIVTEKVGITDFTTDTETGTDFVVDVIAYINNRVEAATSSGSAGLTDEQKETINSVDLTGEIGAEILNFTLNNTILSVFATKLGESTVEDLINGLLLTNCDLTTALEDLWSEDRLLGSPVGTIVELMPVLTVVVDELLVPFIFNGEYENGDKDQYNGFIYSLLSGSLIADYTTDAGSYIGITQLGWDLNELLPDVLHWILEGTSYKGVDYYNLGEVQVQALDDTTNKLAPLLVNAADVDTSDPKHYRVVDQNGNELTRVDDENGVATFEYMGKPNTDLKALLADYPDAQFSYYMTYEDDVPVLTGIYVADLALRDVKISDLESLLGEAIEDPEMGTALTEAITEFATFFTQAVDEFVNTPEYRDQKRYDALNQMVGTGLNNIFVAIPQLFDIAENLFAEKYGIPEDAWTYCYEGKIETNSAGTPVNTSLEEFKSYAGSNDKNRRVDIFDCFAGIFVENWLNAIISLANNLVSVDNKISNELPIITGLLNSLGGFGDKSILTDLFNSIFQITRESKFSFTFDSTNEDENNKFTGLSKDNAFFLITNISKLVEVIQDLIKSFDENSGTNETTDTTTTDTGNSGASGKVSTAPYAKTSTYSNQDLSNATDLINNLDKMLSSLLADTTLNDFSFDKTDNIFAGLISLLSNYIGNDFADSSDEIVSLLNSYLYYITGSDTHKAGSDNNVDAKKVYTNDSLTGLVVETYSLVEKIAAKLLEKYNCTYTLSDDTETTYNLLVEAIDGIVSPDAVSVRLEGDYDKAATEIAKYNSWSNMAATTSRGDYKVSIDWGIKAGDKNAFYNGLAASLRVLTSVIGVLLIDTGWYSSVVTPVLGALCTPNGINLEKIETLVADKNSTGYYDKTLLAVITPVSEFINLFLSKPATTLIKSLQGIAGILDDKNGDTIASILKGAITPLADEINGLANILDKDISNLSPTGAGMIRDLATQLTDLVKTDSNNALVGIEVGNGTKYPLSGSNVIPIVNTYLSGLGVTLNNIDWNKLSTASSPASAVIYLLEYVLDILPNVVDLGDFAELIEGLSAEDLIEILNKVLEVTDSPTMAYWTFVQYLQDNPAGFKYPTGITAQMANDGVKTLDSVVGKIFPLLSSFGIDLGDSLKDVLNGNLFTNDILTQLATALYGALDGLDPNVKSLLNGLGIATSTSDVAKLLTDKSYGATFTAAANTIKAQSSWSKVTNVNWGFKDGSSNAQQGFVNALVAILRPLNSVLEVFLSEGTLHIDDALFDLISNITVAETTTSLTIEIDENTTYNPQITYSMKSGVLTLTIVEDSKNSSDSKPSTLKIDFKSLKNLDDLKIEGTNGYNSAIIPLLEALQCSDVKTYAQYQNDVAKAKDNLLLDILNPLFGSTSSSLLSKLVAAPVATLTDVLPSVAMYIDSNGLSQLIVNLIAPVSNLIEAINPVIDLNKIVTDLLSKNGIDLASILSDYGVADFKLDLSDLEGTLSYILNMDVVVSLINKLLKDNGIDIVIPDIDLAFLAGLGTTKTYTSKAVDENGKYLTGKTVDADNGKVLVTVLRYIADVLINNSSALKNLICSIEAVSKNDTIVSIITSVFNTIATAQTDDVVCAVFYLLNNDSTTSGWSFEDYLNGESKVFKYPAGVTAGMANDAVETLDSVVGKIFPLLSSFGVDLGSDLQDVLDSNLFTNEILTKLATALYGALDGLDPTIKTVLNTIGIATSTKDVAKLLTDKSYGATYSAAAKAISAKSSWSKVTNVNWGFKDGSSNAQQGFVNALAAILRPLNEVLAMILNEGSLNIYIDGVDEPGQVNLLGTNAYNSAIIPLLEAFQCSNVKTYAEYQKDVAKAKDNLLLDILNPLFGSSNKSLLSKLVAAPVTTLTDLLPNIAMYIDSDGLSQLIANLIAPVSSLLDAVRPIADLNDIVEKLLDANDVDLASILSQIGVKNFKLDVYNLEGTLSRILNGDVIVSLINTLLKNNGINIVLPDIDFAFLASLGTAKTYTSKAVDENGKYLTGKTVDADNGKVLVTVLRYIADVLINNASALKNLICSIEAVSKNDTIVSIITSVFNTIATADTDEIVCAVFYLLNNDSTLAAWSFDNYLNGSVKEFKYPDGITADMANDGVEQLDQIVSAIFPLLSSFGVDLGNDLQDVLNNKLFTNEILTKLATALYGALDGLDPTIKTVLNTIGIATSTKDVAKLLTDKSYGATYSAAAKAISAKSSWSKVTNVNWGFKDGAANAQQGFVNALAAILRPLNEVLAMILNEGSLNIYIDGVDEPGQVNLLGTNAYNSAIIPLLEALQCSDVKTYAEYQKDVAKAKDNLLLDILNPLFGSSNKSLLSKLIAAPFTTLTDLLPNIAMYIDGDGLSQLIANLIAPVSSLLDAVRPIADLNDIVAELLDANDVDLASILSQIGVKNFKLDVYNLEGTLSRILNGDVIVSLINTLLKNNGINIVIPDIDFAFLASLGTAKTYTSKAVDENGKYLTGKTVDADNGKVLVTVLRYIADILINNASALKNLICSIEAVSKNDIIVSIIRSVFNTISTAQTDDIVRAVFYLLASNPTNAFWDYTAYETGSYSFSYPEGVDVDFLKNLPPMLDGLVSSLVDLNGLITENLFTDSIITKLAKGLYGAIEGVKINDDLNLTQLLAQTDIDFSTDNVAKLLVDEDYGQTYESQAAAIKAAGSWKNVSDDLKWGVKDSDSFFHALVAVLRPIYGVLDVLLNDAYLGLFDIVRIPGSNGYSSSIVPLMEAFSMYNIKTQYQYRQDMTEEYDAILLDIINPLWDKVEDILSAPLQTVAAMLPNLALFIGNNGLCQIIENLFTPVSALADAIRPVVDLNSLLTTVLDALNVDLNSLLGKIGVTNFSLDLYDLKETLKPLLGADAIIPLVNNILGMIDINGTPLGIQLNPVDWLQLASHGKTIVSASQAATFGPRIFVEGDSSETLIAVLKYLIVTINTGGNYDAISSLIGGLLGGSGSDMSGTINEVLSMLEGDTDQVIADLVGLLQTVA